MNEFESILDDTTESPTRNTFHLANLWDRYGAFTLDFMLFFIIFYFFGLLFMGGTLLTMAAGGGFDEPDPLTMLSGAFTGFLVFIIAFWLYFAAMESSKYQATLGKMAAGLKVVDQQGNRISFGRATGRFLSKFLSSLVLGIGFWIAGFTEKNQGLHDIIAGTLIIKNPKTISF